MVPMVAERRSLAGCLTEIFRGELHLIPFDNVVSSLRQERSAVAVAIRPLFLRLREAEAAELPDAWRAFDRATVMLADLTALEDWGGGVLSETLRAAAVQILSARHDVLETVVDTHLSRLGRFRSDPHACSMEQHLLTWRLLERSWQSNFAKFKGFKHDSVRAHARSCHETLQGLANGAPVEVWVSRFARCVDIELAIDSCLPSSYASLATSCATTWLNHSLPLLPWILAFLISPTKQLDLTVLQRLRKALEVCKDSQALAHMRDAFVNACALLCAAAWLQMEPVSWLTSLLHAIHEACQVVLPEISPGSLAAAMAVSLAPALGESKEHPPPQPPPWKALGIDSPAGALNISDLPRLPPALALHTGTRDVAESIARALHGEVKRCSAAGGIWPGMMGPLLLLFRLLPDAGGAPLLWQARLMSLRALRGFRVQDSEEIHLEHRLLDFFRNECGHGHSLLRHVAEILRESSSNDSAEVFKATTLNMAAASSLNFNSISMLSLSGSPPTLFSASRPIVEAQSRWAESYLSRYPNRKLRWRIWGAAKVLWSHDRGQTLLTTTELQAHILLALGQGEGFSRKDFEEAALSWSQADSEVDQDLKLKPWRLALAQLSAQKEGPVELDSERLRVRPSCGCSELDLTEVPDFSTENQTQEPSSPSRDARAPIIDAALVRILKSCHVLSADEVLAKLAAYPESLALPENLPNTAFSTARLAAQDSVESFGRLSSLCDRGILRMERLDGETTGPVDGATRIFYEE
ncbi:eif2a [Symbiodinium sp. CCMP2592]|nr:eif2a [Symbiodinium sp. CCMP2592]